MYSVSSVRQTAKVALQPFLESSRICACIVILYKWRKWLILEKKRIASIVPAGSTPADMRFNFENCYIHRSSLTRLNRLKNSDFGSGEWSGKRKKGNGWQNCMRTAMIVLPLLLDIQMVVHRSV